MNKRQRCNDNYGNMTVLTPGQYEQQAKQMTKDIQKQVVGTLWTSLKSLMIDDGTYVQPTHVSRNGLTSIEKRVKDLKLDAMSIRNAIEKDLVRFEEVGKKLGKAQFEKNQYGEYLAAYSTSKSQFMEYEADLRRKLRKTPTRMSTASSASGDDVMATRSQPEAESTLRSCPSSPTTILADFAASNLN